MNYLVVRKNNNFRKFFNNIGTENVLLRHLSNMALESLFHIFFARFSVSLFAVAFVVVVNFISIAGTRFRGHQSSAISAVQFVRKIVRDVGDGTRRCVFVGFDFYLRKVESLLVNNSGDNFRIDGIIRFRNADTSLVVQDARDFIGLNDLLYCVTTPFSLSWQ